MSFGHNGTSLRVQVLSRPCRSFGKGNVRVLAGVEVVLRHKSLKLRKRTCDAVIFLGVLWARLDNAYLR